MPPGEKSDVENSEEFEWTVENETFLFHSMIGNKPAGINKYFHMVAISDKFSNFINKEIPTEVIWSKLETMYNLKILDEIEGIPFPNDDKDFTLPENEYGSLLKQKIKDQLPLPEDIEERSASPRNQFTPRSVSRGAGSKETTAKAKKESVEKTPKTQTQTKEAANTSVAPTVLPETPNSSKIDPRRDSKDSNASSKEGGSSTKSSTTATVAAPPATSKTPTPKEGKIPKSVGRPSLAATLEKQLASERSAENSDEGSASKRGVKRPLRGSLKPEDTVTPPSRRRRI